MWCVVKILGCLAGVICTAVVVSGAAVVITNPVDDDGGEFKLSIVHLNDFHARFDESSTSSGACKGTDCIGGFSRVYTAVTNLMNTRPNALFLNAGDNFQGTLWYNLFKWNVTQHFLNMLPTDAITLGNHEFDDKIEGLVPFLETINAPVVVSNIDDTEEPTMQGLHKKSTVVERGGKKIGIVGVILSTTNLIASTGKLKFFDESESVNAEAQRLLDEEGVFTVIVLSHCGYEVEQKIARDAIPGISVVVGAHSHTLLYNGEPPNGVAYGEYPTVIENSEGKKVLVVQASAYTKYLGDITVDFAENGDVISWEGTPIYLDDSVPQDDNINALLAPWKAEVEEEGNRVLGESKVLLNQGDCRYAECSLGNFITDAMVAHYVKIAAEGSWTYAPIAFVNAGGIRTSIQKGEITFNDLATAQPFANTIDAGELQGKYIKEMLETAAMPYNSKRVYADVNLLQVSGIRVVMDLSKPEGSRIVSLRVRCNECDVPRYDDIQPDTYYRIAVNSFMVDGGDGYAVLTENLRNHMIGDVDADVIASYIEQQSPVITGLDERITIIGDVTALYHG